MRIGFELAMESFATSFEAIICQEFLPVLSPVFRWGVYEKSDSEAHAPWEHVPEVVNINLATRTGSSVDDSGVRFA